MTGPPTPRRAPSARGRGRTLGWVSAAVAVAAIAAGVTAAIVFAGGVTTDDGVSGDDRPVQASALSKAALAAADAEAGTPEHDAAAYLSEQPTAYWLTPESTPVTSVQARIGQLASEARDQSARLAIVVYGLPDRDCGGLSAGGLDDDAYAEWTAAIGEALAGAGDLSPIVMLEPDSLALAPECGGVDARVRHLRGAIDALAAPATRIYVDGGHSNWLPIDEMAGLIERLDADGEIRGFATNVSNFNRTADEVSYAHALSARLGGLHAVIDTSRNGAGSNGEWCNPPGRLVGDPGGTIADDVVDANLWIKPPGESDGACNGGPPAGEWWPEAAVELTRRNVAR
ncbi:glycoside hydrolase family 6 protein [Microbacterium sp. BWT-B31]|uniref:glycoside hydrolase family 6 protein n=1 Tax=Microbacterium sp. BWT-B31 TaxID=3232072 RepID=UPI0035291655